ncbi:LOW QUALITY PROTEIN: putative CCR4-associated factor 1 homolog 4 [Cucumis melo]|uniref:poly(A)-specific ribonuclease n=1 Tax=Cucumis melo TaxID=3656 RepID=A0ABM3KER3_CUCME|nr:LOW QUALITY PROTEIN: putative CCR4-associated factor 1 homolog 4 [Cucumis melo]
MDLNEKPKEITQFDECLRFHTILTIDIEFPGFITQSPWDFIDKEIYKEFRFNVNQTKLIQLGVTTLDDLGRIGSSWYSDFDFHADAYSPSTIMFLEKNGLNFKKLKEDGISIASFTKKFSPIIKKLLPKSMEEFATVVVNKVGIVRDLNHMARFCEGLEDGRLGLERLGKLLNKKKFGMKHNAGSDSLLTTSAHFEMVK